MDNEPDVFFVCSDEQKYGREGVCSLWRLLRRGRSFCTAKVGEDIHSISNRKIECTFFDHSHL